MIRLAWLQFRAQAVTAPRRWPPSRSCSRPPDRTWPACTLPAASAAARAPAARTWPAPTSAAPGGRRTRVYLISVASILLAPAVIGLFWGAPLIAHELETGTSALAWTQCITRTRWLAVKLAVGGLAAMAVTEGMSLMQAWWAAPIGRAVGCGGSAAAHLHDRPVRLAGFRHPRHHPARLRRVRLHPRRHRRRADRAHRARHGRRAGRLRRHPDRHAAVDPPAPLPGPPGGHPGHLTGRDLAPLWTRSRMRLFRQQLYVRCPEPPRPARRLAPVQHNPQRRRAGNSALPRPSASRHQC